MRREESILEKLTKEEEELILNDTNDIVIETFFDNFSLDKGCGTFLHKVISVKPPPPLLSPLQVFHVSYKLTTIYLSYTIIH